MTTYPVFAQIRAERAAREHCGVVLPFSPTVNHEVAAENVTAASWHELWNSWFNIWGNVYQQTIDMARDTTLAALDNCIIDFGVIRAARLERMTCERMEVVANQECPRRAEAEHSAQLIREIFLEF